MTDSWRLSDKKVFEFRVCNSKYYFFFEWLPFTIVCVTVIVLIVLSILKWDRDDVDGFLYLAVIPSVSIGKWFGRKYASGKLRITVDDEGMNFSWIKPIPSEHHGNMRILFKDVTSYRYMHDDDIDA